MSKLDTSAPEAAGGNLFFNPILKWCKKNCKVIFIGAAVFVVAIIVPVYWQFLQHRDWGILEVWCHVFSGSIDWSAWWEFGTFIVAIGAALIAYSEYKTHQRELQPKLVPILDIAPSTDLRSDHYHGHKLAISNAGGGTALRIKAYWTVEGQEPDKDPAPVNALLLIGALRPNGEHLWFDHKGDESYPFPIDRFSWRDGTDEADVWRDSTFTLHITWQDAAGNSFKYPDEGYPLAVEVKQVKHYKPKDAYKPIFESHITDVKWPK